MVTVVLRRETATTIIWERTVAARGALLGRDKLGATDLVSEAMSASHTAVKERNQSAHVSRREERLGRRVEVGVLETGLQEMKLRLQQ